MPLTSRVPATLTLPVLVPPPVSFNLPAATETVPLLSNFVWMSVESPPLPPVFSKLPSLVNVTEPVMMPSLVALNVWPFSFLILASPLPAIVLPFQAVLPASVSSPASDFVPVPEIVTLPVLLTFASRLPPDQSSEEKSAVPVPVTEPAVRSSLPPPTLVPSNLALPPLTLKVVLLVTPLKVVVALTRSIEPAPLSVPPLKA